MTGLPVQFCEACEHAVFPPRVLCPSCGSSNWRTELVTSGTAELVTTHSRGGLIASVATDAGPVVLARADETVTPGSKVVVGVDGLTPTVHGGN